MSDAVAEAVYNPWKIAKQRPVDPDGRNPVWGNFKREGWEDQHLFVREFLQNTLDSRRDLNSPAIVKFRFLTSGDGIRADFNRRCLKSLEPHLLALGLGASRRNYSKPDILVIEEYNTTGLTGAFSDSRAKGNWAGFFHGEAKEDKTGGKNGRAGQGKTTYHIISESRAVFALTEREDDRKLLLMGKCSLERTHTVGSQNFMYRGFWSMWDGEQPLPFEDPSIIREFKEAYVVERSTGQIGTTFIIPFPIRELTPQAIIKVVIEDFFFSVIRGRLVIHAGDAKTDHRTIFALLDAFPPEPATAAGHQRPSNDFLRFVKDCLQLDTERRVSAKKEWNGTTKIPEDLFNEADLQTARDAIDDGKIVWFRLPVQVSHKFKGRLDSYIDVYLRSDYTIKRTEEAFIRTDLYIASEKRLTRSTIRAFGLVVAEDEAISEFLANAEEASHLRWNAREPKLTENYSDVPRTLRIVRGSSQKLLDLVKGFDVDADEELLIDVLSIPVEIGNKKSRQNATRGGKKKAKPPKPPGPITPSKRYFEIVDGNGIKLKNGPDPIPSNLLPVSGYLIVAYDNVAAAGEAFRNYHPWDFDLENETEFPRSVKNASIISATENRIEFSVTDPDFEIEISGFDLVRPLKAKANISV